VTVSPRGTDLIDDVILTSYLRPELVRNIVPTTSPLFSDRSKPGRADTHTSFVTVATGVTSDGNGTRKNQCMFPTGISDPPLRCARSSVHVSIQCTIVVSTLTATPPKWDPLDPPTRASQSARLAQGPGTPGIGQDQQYYCSPCTLTHTDPSAN
jgi:hypothetical protein